VDRDEFLAPLGPRFDRVDGGIERMEARLDQYHGETRELVEAMLTVVRDNALASRELVRSVRELREMSAELRAEAREGRDQLRANTEAILRLLDRFANGGGPAPAAG